ncbi:unnamed protein product [Amoebophrya sp. A120]|nr:unnamed protein product [Amoebophrya sp. A120]|eukprot:GSA120T00025949001.1
MDPPPVRLAGRGLLRHRGPGLQASAVHGRGTPGSNTTTTHTNDGNLPYVISQGTTRHSAAPPARVLHKTSPVSAAFGSDRGKSQVPAGQIRTRCNDPSIGGQDANGPGLQLHLSGLEKVHPTSPMITRASRAKLRIIPGGVASERTGACGSAGVAASDPGRPDLSCFLSCESLAHDVLEVVIEYCLFHHTTTSNYKVTHVSRFAIRDLANFDGKICIKTASSNRSDVCLQLKAKHVQQKDPGLATGPEPATASSSHVFAEGGGSHGGLVQPVAERPATLSHPGQVPGRTAGATPPPSAAGGPSNRKSNSKLVAPSRKTQTEQPHAHTSSGNEVRAFRNDGSKFGAPSGELQLELPPTVHECLGPVANEHVTFLPEPQHPRRILDRQGEVEPLLKSDVTELLWAPADDQTTTKSGHGGLSKEMLHNLLDAPRSQMQFAAPTFHQGPKSATAEPETDSTAIGPAPTFTSSRRSSTTSSMPVPHEEVSGAPEMEMQALLKDMRSKIVCLENRVGTLEGEHGNTKSELQEQKSELKKQGERVTTVENDVQTLLRI